MRNKISSVEWLIEQVKSKEWQDKFIWHKEDVFEEARLMENAQKKTFSETDLRLAFMQGYNRGRLNEPDNLENYIDFKQQDK
jgi:hypothetical protein